MSVEVLTPSGLAFDTTVPLAKAEARGGLLAPYWELTKPRLVLLVLFTTAVGYWLGSHASFDWLVFLATLVGTALVAGGACTWNQVLERSPDALMRRTARRPLPSRQVGVFASSCFGSALTIAGILMLAWVDLTAACVALATFLLYVCIYTPLKSRTTLNTAVGAVPGALPCVIGWAAATGRLSAEGWTLFLIVFLWQFPHFLAIAWIYREDYARAGMRMLPCIDPLGKLTATQAVVFSLLLLPAGLLPTVAGLAGYWCAAGSLVLGLVYLNAALRFARQVSDQRARDLMRASFLYLPVLLLLLLANSYR
jgi:protoheme IX farnesyltransferase